MAKKVCAFCGKTLKFLDGKDTLKDGTICQSCEEKIGLPFGKMKTISFLRETSISELQPHFDSNSMVNIDEITNAKKDEHMKEVLTRVNASSKNMEKESTQHKESYFEKIARENEEKKIPHCPKCNSRNLQILGQHKKGFSLGKAVGGAVLTGGIGTLAGFAGKRTKKVDVICMNCGNKFKM